jgi:hypothetical protein
MGDPVKRHGIDWDSPNFTGYFYTSEEFVKEPFFITQPDAWSMVLFWIFTIWSFHAWSSVRAMIIGSL